MSDAKTARTYNQVHVPRKYVLEIPEPHHRGASPASSFSTATEGTMFLEPILTDASSGPVPPSAAFPG
jgi:hypothetical protein